MSKSAEEGTEKKKVKLDENREAREPKQERLEAEEMGRRDGKY